MRGSNPFAVESGFYVNSEYQARVQASIHRAWVDDATRSSLASMAETGSAFWIDTIGKVYEY